MNVRIWVVLASSLYEFVHKVIVFLAPYTTLLQAEVQPVVKQVLVLRGLVSLDFSKIDCGCIELYIRATV